MKKFFFLVVLTMLTAVNVMGQSGDKLFVDNFSINPGEKLAVSVNLSNPDTKYCVFQFDLNLPKGIAVALNKKNKLDVKLNEDRIDDHTLTSKQISDGVYRFTCISLTNANFYENSGAILELNIEASSTLTGVTMTGSIENIVLATSASVETKLEKTTFTITNPTAAGITAISVDQPADIYDIKGNLLRSQATNLNGLPKGIYLVKGQKVLVK